MLENLISDFLQSKSKLDDLDLAVSVLKKYGIDETEIQFERLNVILEILPLLSQEAKSQFLASISVNPKITKQIKM